MVASTKEEALLEVQKLMVAFQMTVEDISPGYCEQQAASEEHFGYQSFFTILGGLLIACAFIFYSDTNGSGRSTLSMMVGVLLYLVAFLLSGRVLGTTLFVLAAVFQSFGLLAHFHTIDDVTVIIGGMFLQFLLGYWLSGNSGAIFIAILLGCAFLIVVIKRSRAGLPEGASIFGLLLLILTFMFDTSANHAVVPFFYFLSSSTLLGGTMFCTINTDLELVLPSLILCLLCFSGWTHSRALSFNGSLAMVGYIWHLIRKNLKRDLGGPATLLLIGVSVIFIGWAAFR